MDSEDLKDLLERAARAVSGASQNSNEMVMLATELRNVAESICNGSIELRGRK